MIADAKEGKIDLILTKSISRFARNTVTLLETIRELKAIDVGVYFEEQNINTLTSEGELLISILASYAQEESRSCSENCLWRVKRNFEQGKMYGGDDCLGYKLVNQRYELVPEEAELVKRIFDLYLAGNGFQKIARILNEEGTPSKYGGVWHEKVIRYILTNRNYTGDLLLQKTYRENHITKLKKVNYGEKNQYLVEDDHEPIISKEVFEKAQAILEGKRIKYFSGETNKVYPFTGIVICGKCGKSYHHKVGSYREHWVCVTFERKGKQHCNMPQVRDEILREKSCEALGLETFNEDIFKSKIERIEMLDGYVMNFVFKDGSQKRLNWCHKSRSLSWTPEMREAVRQKNFERMGVKNNG